MNLKKRIYRIISLLIFLKDLDPEKLQERFQNVYFMGVTEKACT